MIDKIIMICIWAAISTQLSAIASTEVYNQELSCGEIKGVYDFVSCALKVHPDAQALVFDNRLAEGILQKAKQVPNPQLEAGIGQTNNIGLSSDTLDLKLLFSIELGEKRAARIKKSEAEASLIQSEILQTKESIVIRTLVKLYRLRQVLEEIELMEESLHTFREVKTLYSQRKSLGPEQAVSLDVFSLAEADYSMRRSALESERGELIRDLSLSIGQNIKLDQKFLPKFQTFWPKLPPIGNSVGSNFKIANAQVRIAEGNLALANSEAWPDLAIGPTYSREVQGGDQITSVGISIELPMPIFSLNGGGKFVGNVLHDKANLQMRSQYRNLKNFRENLLQTYESITQRLVKIDPGKFGEEKHKRIHKYLKRGVLGATLVIESHRQIVEFQEHTNEQELRALKALWQVRALDGVLLDELNDIKNP